jgi:peptidoglycan/LPS O-acetylase OafA/YrhL
MVLLLAKGQSWWVRVFCGLGLAVLVWVVGSVNILWLAIPWITGALLVYLPPVPARGPWMRGTAIGVALTLSAAGLKFDEVYPGFADPLFGLAVAFLIWVILYCATAPLPAGYVRLAQRAARSSYTLYLVHFPMLVFLKASLHLPFAVPGWYTFLVGVGLLAVVLVYAQLIYELFEKHTDQVRKWLQPYVMHREPS